MDESRDPVAIVALALALISLGWQVYGHVSAPGHEARVAKRLRREHRQEEALLALIPRMERLSTLAEVYESMRARGLQDEVGLQQTLAKIQGAARGVLATWDQARADIFDAKASKAFQRLPSRELARIEAARSPLEAGDSVAHLLEWCTPLLSLLAEKTE
jgi:hypothetical protein